MGFARSVENWLRSNPVVPDLGLATLLWFILAVPYGFAGEYPAFVVGSIQCFSLSLRRVTPELSFTIVSLACLLSLSIQTQVIGGDLAFLFSVYALAAHSRFRRIRTAGLGVGLLATVIGAFWFNMPTMPPDAVAVSALMLGTSVVLAWSLGSVIRVRREYTARLRAQDEALARDREQRARIAAQDERGRIAREMHDVVAHSLSVVVVQADGAAYAAQHGDAWSREQAVAALTTIARTAREALGETRALVGVLRTGQSAEYAPTTGLDGLDDLLDGVRNAGVRITLDAQPLGSLPRDTDFAAYRIIQESLTNVLKHAGPQAQVMVTLRRFQSPWEAGVLIRVEDDGAGRQADTAQVGPMNADGMCSGILGMRERAAAAGGRLSAEPLPRGGFVVHAELPAPMITGHDAPVGMMR